jgi:hypothetical protein
MPPLGQALGFAALVLLLGAVVALAAMGEPWVSGILATTGMATIVPLFVAGQSPAAPAQLTAQETRLPTGPHCQSRHVHAASDPNTVPVPPPPQQNSPARSE